MSGTFNEIDVPPTLVSFAVDVASDKTIITPELKKAGNKLVLVQIHRDAYDLPDYGEIKDLYGKFFEDVKAGRILSAYALDGSGLAAAVSKMSFGNRLGVKIEANVDKRDLFIAGFGDIVAEVPADKVAELLHIPENEVVTALIAFGYPDEEPAAPRRKAVSDLLTFC